MRSKRTQGHAKQCSTTPCAKRCIAMARKAKLINTAHSNAQSSNAKPNDTRQGETIRYNPMPSNVSPYYARECSQKRCKSMHIMQRHTPANQFNNILCVRQHLYYVRRYICIYRYVRICICVAFIFAYTYFVFVSIQIPTRRNQALG